MYTQKKRSCHSEMLAVNVYMGALEVILTKKQKAWRVHLKTEVS